MAYDGYFPPKKTVYNPSKPHPKAPGGQRPRPSRPGYRPARPSLGRPLSVPKAPTVVSPVPNYGTAVPATDNLVNGIPRQMQFARWLVPSAARSHPWFRTAMFGIDLYNFVVGSAELDLPEALPGRVRYAWGAIPSGWSVCGAPAEASTTWSSSNSAFPTNCARIPQGGQQLVPNAFPGPSAVFYTPSSSPGVGTTRGFVLAPINNANYTGPRPEVIKTLPQAIVTTFPDGMEQNRRRLQRGAPHQLVPYAPTAPDQRLGPTRFNKMPGFSNTNPDTEIKAEPRPGNPGKGRPFVPPRPGTKEKKGKIPRWFAKIAERAWDETEANDLAENLFECLPKKVQKNAPKTGKTHRGSWAGEGYRYTSIVDKARHVHRNLESLDLDCAFRKVSCNHISDMLWGRFFGTVDAGFQRGKVSGYSFATRGSGAEVVKEEWDRFNKWIEGQPALDRLLKSLDCENFGK